MVRPRTTLCCAATIAPGATFCCGAPTPVKRKLVPLAKSVTTVGSKTDGTTGAPHPGIGVWVIPVATVH